MSTRQLLAVLALCFAIGWTPTAVWAVMHDNEVISSNTTWAAADNDHIVVGSVRVEGGATLTIEDGVQVLFANSAYLDVYGSLNAVGTEELGILFTRWQSGWSGLHYRDGSSGSLQYCTIEYATSSNGVNCANATLNLFHCTIRNSYYAVQAAAATSLTIEDCTLGNNTLGIYATGVLPSITNNLLHDNNTGIQISDVPTLAFTSANTIQDNTNGIVLTNSPDPVVSNQTLTGNTGSYGALFVKDCGEFEVGPGNTISGNSWPLTINMGSSLASDANLPTTGNTNDAIQVYGGSTGTAAILWRKLALDYVVTGSPTVDVGGSLTIEDGNQVWFGNYKYIDVYGTLDAVGSPGLGIVFTRWQSLWSGLQYRDGSSGSLQHCTVEYGTASNGISCGDATLSLSHCTLRDNYYAVQATGATSLTLDDCTLGNNTLGIYAIGALPSITNNLLHDNGTGIQISDVPTLAFTTANTIQDNTYGIILSNCPAPVVSNQTLTGNTETALHVQRCGEFEIGVGNTISGNGWPVAIDVASPLASDANLPTTGNTNDFIQVYGGSTAETILWRKLALDYVVTGSPTIDVGGSLTIEDGNQIWFGNYKYIDVYGTLDAVGSPGLGIVFTRWQSLWSGLQYRDGSSGSLQHCTVEYGTASNGIWCGDATLSLSHCTVEGSYNGVRAVGATSLTVDNCTLGNNTHGIYVTGALPSLTDNLVHDNSTGIQISDVPALAFTSANTIQDNTNGIVLTNCPAPVVSNQILTGSTGAALYVQGCGEFEIGPGNTISGNGWPVAIDVGSPLASDANLPTSGNTNDFIQVYGGSTGTAAILWRKLALDYVVTGSPTVDVGGSLTIEDGNQVWFGNYKYIDVYGTLDAVGSPGLGIVFTRWQSLWSGLQYRDGSSGSLQHCTVEYGTASNGISCGDATLSLSHCTVRDSYNGVRAAGATSLSVDNCTLSNNTYGIHATDSSPRITRSLITGNTYGVYFAGFCLPHFGTVHTGNEIHGNGGGSPNRDVHNGAGDIDVPYVYWGTLDEAEIEDKIYHKVDDPGLATARYCPWTNATRDSLYCATVTGVAGDEPKEAPEGLRLFQNSPNPFNPVTQIRFGLPRDAWVELILYDLAGRKVATIHEGFELAGYKTIRWRPEGLSSGTYIYRLRAAGLERAKKLVLIQ